MWLGPVAHGFTLRLCRPVLLAVLVTNRVMSMIVSVLIRLVARSNAAMEPQG